MYYIIEIQESQDGVPSNIVKTAPSRNEALSVYYSTLSFAAISEVYIHTVIVMDAHGQYLARDSFTHKPEEPLPEVTEDA